MLILGTIRVFLDDLWARFRAHTSNASAHHVKYTDAEVDAILAVHTAIVSAHHTKYTDGDAEAAIANADSYVKNTGDTLTGVLRVTDKIGIGGTVPDENLHIEGTTGVKVKIIGNTASGHDMHLPQLFFINKTTGDGFVAMKILMGTGYVYGYPEFWIEASKWLGNDEVGIRGVSNHDVVFRSNDTRRFKILKTGEIDFMNNKIKDPKNGADATLSGTSRVIEILIGATPYYFKVYPTKT